MRYDLRQTEENKRKQSEVMLALGDKHPFRSGKYRKQQALRMKYDNNPGRNRKRKIRGIHIETGEIINFNSSFDLTQAGFDRRAVLRVIKGINTHHKKFKWSFLNVSNNNIK